MTEIRSRGSAPHALPDTPTLSAWETQKLTAACRAAAGHTRWRQVVAAGLGVAALLLLVHVHARYVVTRPLYYDDAHDANVVKNVAFGAGYSTSYHEIVRFNPEASTGPVILLPAAALVGVFGNQYWVPNLAIVLITWVTLAIFAFLLCPYLTRTELWCVTSLTAIGLVLVPDEIGLLGEVPGALLAGAAVLLIGSPSLRPRRLFASGLLLGLAIQAKLLIALVGVPALVYAIARTLAIERRRVGRVGWAVFSFVFAATIPFLAWEAWQAVALRISWSDFIALKANQYRFFATYSGIGELSEAASPAHLWLDKAARNGVLLPEFFGGWAFIAAFCASLALSSWAVGSGALRDRRLTRVNGFFTVLLAAGCLHFGWWLLLSREGFYRHLLPGALYLTFAASLGAVASYRRSSWAGSVAVLALLLSWVPLVGQRADKLPLDYQRDPRLVSLLDATDAVERLRQDPSLVLVGHGWWVARDLEYLLPTVGNFKDVLRLEPADVSGRHIVLVRNEFFNWEDSSLLRSFQAACDRQILFRRDPFVASRCPGLWWFTFPWALSEPRRVREDHSFRGVEAPGGVPATLAHATSALAVPAEQPFRHITIGFGLLDEAWQEGQTDGVEFRVSVMGPDSVLIVWRRFLDPRANARDRGELTATFSVPGGVHGNQLLLETLPGESGDSSWDWAFWSRLDLR